MKFVVAIPILIYRAWVLSVLWRWFVVPVAGFDGIGVAMALGLTCIVVHFSTIPDGSREFSEVAAFAVINTTLALGIGWVALQFA